MKMYYICHNGLCDNKIEVTDLFDMDDIGNVDTIPSIITCQKCHDEMILTVIDEEE